MRPRVALARAEFLVFRIRLLVDRLRVEGRVEVLQQRHDVGVGVADAAHLEAVLVDVDDVQTVFPDAQPMRNVRSSFARPFQELQRRRQSALGVVVGGSWCGRLMR